MTAASRPGLVWSEAQADARARRSNPDPLRILGGALGIADALVIFLASAAAYVLREGLEPVSLEIFSTTLLGVALTINAMYMTGAYTRHATDRLLLQMKRVLQAWSGVCAILLTLGYLTKTSDNFSRIWALGWCVFALVGFGSARLILVWQVRRWGLRGRLARTVAIVDLAGDGDAFAQKLRRRGADSIRLIGVFSDSSYLPPRASINDLLDLARLFRIDEVIVTVSGRGDTDVASVLRRLGTIPANVRLCPALAELMVVSVRETGLFLDVPVLTVHKRPFTGWNSIVKRAEDLIMGTLFLLLLSPLMLLIAALVKLDSRGPIFFRQQRLGFNNNVILVYKFRSMGNEPASGTDVVQARRNDPRVTKVGRLLRRTSFDELPQLFNVILGDMSIVGPRPHALAHNRHYATLIDDYLGRHRVQPGITGWAQVNGFRGGTDTLDKMQRRVEHDLAYIDNWSIFLDLKIMLMTAASIAFQNNAF